MVHSQYTQFKFKLPPSLLRHRNYLMSEKNLNSFKLTLLKYIRPLSPQRHLRTPLVDMIRQSMYEHFVERHWHKG